MDTILIVDDEKSILDLLSVVFKQGRLSRHDQPGDVQALRDPGRRGHRPRHHRHQDAPAGRDGRSSRPSGPRTPTVPIIVITAFGSVKQAVEALKAGALDYVIKPFDIEELKILVAHGLEQRRLREENILLKRDLPGPGTASRT